MSTGRRVESDGTEVPEEGISGQASKVGSEMRPREDIVRLLREVGETLQRLANRAEATGPSNAYILGMYAGCASLFRGSVILIEASLPEEALLLGRRLFEQSLWLSQLSRAGSEATRDALILQWRMDAIVREEGLVSDAVSIGYEKDPEPIREALGEERRKVERYRRDHGVGRLVRFDSALTAAQKDDGLESWLTYKLSHQLVHGNTVAIRFRIFRVDPGTVGIRTSSDEPRWLAAAGVYCAESLLVSFRAIATILQWPIPDEIALLEGEIGRLDDEVSEEV